MNEIFPNPHEKPFMNNPEELEIDERPGHHHHNHKKQQVAKKEGSNMSDALVCVCGSVIKKKEIRDHGLNCTPFKRKYATLWNLIDEHTMQDLDINHYKLIKVILIFFKQKTEKRIQDAMRQPPPQLPPVPMEEAPPILPVKVPPPKQNHQEEEKDEVAPMQCSNDILTCSNCSRCFVDFNRIVYLDKCLHTVCRECLKNIIFREFLEKGEVRCPNKSCRVTLPEFEIRDIMGKEIFEKMQQKILAKFIEKSGLVTCVCGNMMELVQGSIDLKQKDEKGNLISHEAAVHMSKYRVRCNNCSKVFCAKCNADPYHIGFTCEQFKNYQTARKCRFCRNEIVGASSNSNVPAFKNVCKNPECVQFMQTACDKILPCGHPCCGFRGEKICMPCLNEECVNKNPHATMDQNEDSYCPICYTAGLGEQPSVRLECGHILHCHCLLTKLRKGFPGPRITFFFAECPSCRKWVKAPHHPQIHAEYVKVKKLYDVVLDKAIQRLKFEGLDKDKRLSNPNDRFYNKPEEYAMSRLSYYMCFKCKTPYFGGLKACENVNEGNKEYKENELVCGKCSAGSVQAGIRECKIHGRDFIEFKCKFCCSVAQWFCWGTTHFCEDCHTRQNRGDYMSKKKPSELAKCPGPSKCPLKIAHPPNGEEFALGCAICRNQKQNLKEF